jgi:enoyl-CoA hydratase/carnithine racemase
MTEIEIKTADGVQVIRFQRAEKKNALTGPMYAAMSQALEAAETDEAIAVHVFVGSGGVFCAGNDINDFLRRAQATAQASASGNGSGIPTPSLDFIRRLPGVTKPMIAAVDGLAIGVGATMLLHCDLVYATPAASLRQNFPDLGAMIDAEAAAYQTLMVSPEAREAFTAFLEKRPPDFAKARQKG